jgi:hypothetical protein
VAIGCVLDPAVPADHHSGQVGQQAANDVANHVAIKMECQDHHYEDRRAAAGYPASMLSLMRNSGSLYPPYVPRLEIEDKEDAA